MKKNILAGAAALFLVGVTQLAGATSMSFTNTVNFGATGTYSGSDYTLISDSNGTNFVGVYSHTITFNPVADNIESAKLDITYADLTNHTTGQVPQEIWLFYEGGGTSLGQLVGYADSNWHTQTFILDSSLFSNFSGSNWSLGFKFNETTQGNDKFYLDKSVLSGMYTPATTPPNNDPVPEPTTMLLMGTGLTGLVALRRRREKKKN